jgi:RNA polymerase sigma factor (sigma-70 family)
VEEFSVDVQPGGSPGELYALPAAPQSAAEMALEELELIYAFVYARVGNRPDAEDLTQQVAMKAIPRLRQGATVSAVRAYLFATARSALATFWSARFGMPEEELGDDVWVSTEPAGGGGEAAEKVQQILERLPANYRRLLELRFLRGYSLKEVAAEMGSTVGGVKVMQLRALRAAARTEADD